MEEAATNASRYISAEPSCQCAETDVEMSAEAVGIWRSIAKRTRESFSSDALYLPCGVHRGEVRVMRHWAWDWSRWPRITFDRGGYDLPNLHSQAPLRPRN